MNLSELDAFDAAAGIGAKTGAEAFAAGGAGASITLGADS